MLAMKFTTMSALTNRLKQFSAAKFAPLRGIFRTLIVYAPGVSLVLLGFTVLCLPPAVPAVLALFLVCSGIVLIRITSLLCRLGRNLHESLRAIDGRIVLQGMILREGQGDAEPPSRSPEGDAKKDWLH